MAVQLPWSDRNRQVVPGPKNPMDICTVVSIYPKPIDETKPTLQPGRFTLGKGSLTNPAILLVGSSSWWRELSDEEPLLEIPVSSIQIADSVVKDYANGLLGCDMGDCMPGLFYLQGAVTVPTILEKHKAELALYNSKQRNWFNRLVQIGDQLWAVSNGNPLAISDDMRMAAQELNLHDKEWIKDFSTMQMIRCAACGNLNRDNIVVCPNCKVVLNAAKFKELGLQFAS